MSTTPKTPSLLYIPLCLSFLAASGCGSDSPSDAGSTTANKYQGTWSNTAANTYLKIDNKGAVTLYTCAFTEGYKTDGIIAANIKGDTLVPTTSGISPAKITPANNTSELSYVSQGEKFSFKKVSKLPDVCTKDGIRITAVTPATAVEGEATSFSVSFTYQVESTSDAVIKPGFTSKAEGTFVLTDDELKVTKKGLSSGNMTVVGTPVIFENKKPFKLHLVMQKAEDQGNNSITAISSAESTIIVTAKP